MWASVTHQLGCAWFENDGQHIRYTSYTVHKAEQDKVIICKARSWVRKKIEHREIYCRLDHCIKMVNRILREKISQAAHARSTLPPVVQFIQGE